MVGMPVWASWGDVGTCSARASLNPAVFHMLVQEGPGAKQQGLSQWGKLRYETPFFPQWPACVTLRSPPPVWHALAGWHHPSACPVPAGQLCARRQQWAEPSALLPAGLRQAWGGLGAARPRCLSFPSGRSRRAVPGAYLIQGQINRGLKNREGCGWPVAPQQSPGQSCAVLGSPYASTWCSPNPSSSAREGLWSGGCGEGAVT